LKCPIQKYLTSYAATEVAYLDCQHLSNYRHVVVIPSFDETINTIKPCLNNADGQWQQTLLILVVNRPDNHAANARNIALMQQLQRQLHLIWQRQNLYLLTNPNGCDLLLADREQRPIPAKYGVGMARKIGCDLALKCMQQGRIKQHLIYNSDMDVSFPKNYLKTVQVQSNQVAAYLYPFIHTTHSDPKVNRAMQSYHDFLMDYQQQLQQLNSPYAWVALGSTLIVKADAYAAVRGFPKRSAGEDFYMLNKLTKIGEIQQLDSQPINIATRLSTRVPFGTGTRLQSILEGNTLPDYNQSYPYLQQWYQLWQPLFAGKCFDNLKCDSRLRQYLTKQPIKNWVKQAHQVSRGQWCHFQKSMHHQFDALKVLQFLKHFAPTVTAIGC